MKLLFRAKPEDAIKFLIYCVFLLYLVAIAILNIHTFSTEGYFWGLNPLPAFGSEFLITTLVFYVLAVVASIMSVSGFFIKRDKGFGFARPKEEPDGYEKMAEEKAAKGWKDIEKVILADKDYSSGGVPFILKDKEAWVNNGEDHTIIIGSTGSGKTECGILPTVRILAKAGESMIITDPKGEIYKKTGALLKEKGYKIILLNFREPLNGNAWNPFMLPYKFYKEGKVDKSMELLEDLGTNILIDPNNKGEPFWENASRDYFTGLSIGLFEDAEEKQININSVNLMATQGEEKIGRSTYDKEYFSLKGEMSSAYISASAVITTAADTKSGVLSTFRTKTRIFSSREALSEMLSYSDFDFSTIGKEKTAIFMMIHDEKKTYHSLMTIFVKQVYESLIDEAYKFENGKLPIRTNFLLDEFANMPALKDVDSMITASRSRNIRFTFIIQNFSQLNQVYGADMAETIKGNCNIHFLLTTELKALEEISKLCGDKKPPKPKDGMPGEPIRPLVTISDLQHMKKFEFLIKKMRFSPFKTLFTPDFKLKEKNAWNCSYEAMEFPKREYHTPEVFDLKAFVNKKNEELGKTAPGAMPSGFAGGMGLPFGDMTGGFNPFMSSEQPKTMGSPSTIDFDELSKKIDAKIAELEAEEAKEAENLGKSIDNNEKTQANEIELKEITPATILPTEPKQNIMNTEPLVSNVYEKNDIITNPLPSIDKVDTYIYNNMQSIDEEKEEIEKPKVNVDVDSIIVNDNITDDDFFDDFFDE